LTLAPNEAYAGQHGHDGKVHSAHFFELADPPVGVTVMIEEAKGDVFMAALGQGTP